MKIISVPYISEINEILDHYIKTKEIGEEIYSPLNSLIEDIEELSLDAFKKLDNNFLKKSKGEHMSNFLFYHSVRNLKLTTLKIIDGFKQAKEKMLNPVVAKQLKTFIEHFIKFLIYLKMIQESKSLLDTDLLSEELEKFRNFAKETSFLCNVDEELKYDKISHHNFRNLIKSIRNIHKEEFHE